MRKANRVPSLVLRETHVLAYVAKWTLRVVFLLAASLALARHASAAPVVFEASGNFPWSPVGPSELSGTITIDPTLGSVLSADLTLTSRGAYDAPQTYRLTTLNKTDVPGRILLEGSNPIGDLVVLQLQTTALTWVGFDGGPLVSDESILHLVGIDANSLYMNPGGTLEPK
jgi:hypothetical protein